MEHILTTFAHGHGPYMRIIDLGIAINRALSRNGHKALPIIVPLAYGDVQKRIIS